jgi:hypothetical protein
VNEIIIGITNEVQKVKLIDSQTLNEIKATAYKALMMVDDKIYNHNLLKKLNHFAKMLLDNLFMILNFEEASRLVVLEVMYKALLKKGAHYLRHDSLQILREGIEEGLFVTNDSSGIDGNSFVNIGAIASYLKEIYIDKLNSFI